MSETIKPALTREEWVAPRVMFRPADEDHAGYGIELLARREVRYEWQRPQKEDWAVVFDDSWSVPLDAVTRHALAALALHQQPFGFTREDVANEIAAAVECERWAASSEGTVLDDDKVPELLTRAYLHRSLAARIEALLPPEEK